VAKWPSYFIHAPLPSGEHILQGTHMTLFLSLHLLSAVIWVGGMFFAYMVLRPVAAKLLEPPARLQFMASCFAKFFVWVWIAISLLFITGYAMTFQLYSGFANAPIFVHAMHGIGIIMALIFMHVYFAPYRHLCHAVKTLNWQDGGKALVLIRRLVAINLALGLLLICIVSVGRHML